MTTERERFEEWAIRILSDNPTWRESGDCELAWQAWQAAEKQKLKHMIAHLEWKSAPMRTEYGAGMLVADFAISKDETATVCGHKDAVLAAARSAA